MLDQPVDEAAGPSSAGAGWLPLAENAREILDGLLEGCLVLGFDWSILYVNQAAARTLQRTGANLLGRTMCPGFEPSELFGPCRRCMEERVPQRFEGGFTFANGVTNRWDVSALPVPEGIFVHGMEIRGLEKTGVEGGPAGERFKKLIERAPDGITLVDPANGIVFASPAARRIFGFGPHESTADVSPTQFTHPDDLPMVLAALQTLLGDPTYVPTLEYRFRHKEGEWLWLESTFTNMLGVLDVDAIVINFRDVTDRKIAEARVHDMNALLEQRVRERTAELEAANRELDAFSHSVSHDLRAPLRAITGFSTMVTRDHAGQLDAEGRRLLEVVSTNARRMSMLIDDLLLFSRTVRAEPRRARVDMSALVRSSFEEISSDPAVRTKVDFRPGEIPDAEGDAALLRQVWVNLLSNAVKFSAGEQHPVIEVSGAREGSWTVYRVRDNGVGFDMKYVDKLFGVFQRLHGPTEFEGSGIGLALVKRIVARHGGQVRAEGAVGEGATFSFSLSGSARSRFGGPGGEPG